MGGVMGGWLTEGGSRTVTHGRWLTDGGSRTVRRRYPCVGKVRGDRSFLHTDTSCTPGCGNGMLLFLDRMCRFYSSAGRGNAIS